MPAKKVKRKYVRKALPQAAEVEDVVIPTILPEVVEHKQHYLVCHFCGNRQTDLNSRDQTSFWCHQCGRCNQAVWTTT